jgi:uncharacterized protein YbbK (DUF523 family)
MQRILVSGCLIGLKVRYNASDAAVQHEIWTRWQREGRLMSLCPELAAGFPVPRPPAEILGGEGRDVLNEKARIVEDTGADVTAMFIQGAHRTLEFARQHNLHIAVLTDGSPSCGTTYIYDGSFQGATKQGKGVVATLLEQHGIRVFADSKLTEADSYLDVLESNSQI